MRIIDFTKAHADEAMALALTAYDVQRRHVPSLPVVETVPDLAPLADNGLGVTAFDGGHMVGFLACYPPYAGIFHSTDAVGVFSPMGGNAAMGDNRASVYARMYEAAAKKWVGAGASSHAVCTYAHDRDVLMQFFRYGFGMRCVDVMRGMDAVGTSPPAGYTFVELSRDRYAEVYPLALELDEHMAASPCFIRRVSDTEEAFLQSIAEDRTRLFAALRGGVIAAVMKVSRGTGETFADKAPGTLHVNMGYCLPEHRGSGAAAGLLGFMVDTLKSEGLTRLAVDFESINPTAWGFWLKHFDAYTYGLVRRIDEHAVGRRS